MKIWYSVNSASIGKQKLRMVLSDICFWIELMIGVCLQIRIIHIAWKKREVTWESQIFHSIVLIIFFSTILSFETVCHINPDIKDSAVWGWIYEICRYLRIWGFLVINWHSLSVSIHKYIVIVHNVTSDRERRKIAVTMLLIVTFFQVLWAASIYIKYRGLGTFLFNDLNTASCKPRAGYFKSIFPKVGNFCLFNSGTDNLADGKFF